MPKCIKLLNRRKSLTAARYHIGTNSCGKGTHEAKKSAVVIKYKCTSSGHTNTHKLRRTQDSVETSRYDLDFIHNSLQSRIQAASRKTYFLQPTEMHLRALPASTRSRSCLQLKNKKVRSHRASPLNYAASTNRGFHSSKNENTIFKKA